MGRRPRQNAARLKVLVDSSVWIDFINGEDCWQTRCLDELVDREFVLVGDLILCEVLQGFRRDSDFEAAKEMLDKLHFVTLGSYEVAVEAANSFRYLRRKGITIRKTVDMIIAAFCIVGGILLLHNDRDFDALEEHLSLECVAE